MTDATADAARGDVASSRPPRSRTRTWVDLGVIVVIGVLAATLLRSFVLEAYLIPSLSMSPTMHVGDWIVVDKLSYDFGSPRLGSIVVFARPPGDSDTGVTDLVKRVIGLPGQSIESLPGGGILIDGKLIAQPWLTADARANPGPSIPKMTIPKGDYFVMGDNRSNSGDSRYFGPISGRLLVGRAILRIWPLSHFHWF